MSASDGAEVCFYTLDADDRIVDYGGPGWGAFADENGAPRLGRAELRGVSIYAHVAGHFTRRFLREFFLAGRAAKAPLTRVYRCDSPRLKRHMEMRACVEDNGGCASNIGRSTRRPCRSRSRRRNGRLADKADYSRCSICNRLRRLGEQAWREPDEAGAVGVQRVVHTVCKSCRSGISSHPPLRPIAMS